MITKEYSKAYREVIEILSYLPKDDLKKIPKEKINFYRANMDMTYNYKLDETKELKKQKISDITRAILANIYRDYWATPNEKEKIKAKERFELNMLEEEKRKKYNPDDIFKNYLN